MTTTAWFHCHAGTAGDMTLGALVDAGADPDEIVRILGGLDLDGWVLSFERVQRCGVGATWAVVLAHGEHEAPSGHGHEHAHTHEHEHEHGHEHAHAHRPYREIRALLERGDLPDRVRVRALAVFDALATVEGALHGIPADDVELHEVGAIDAIVDIVGTCAALESLGVDRIVCSPITVGMGTVRAAHGELPNPAPATVALLARRGAPSRGLDVGIELATPTGVALMTVLADEFGPLPPLTVTATGMGAGTLDTPGRPNVVQVVIGTLSGTAHEHDTGRPAVLLEANVDDVTPEVLAHTIARLLEAGAHDAWVTPIVMKKGRAAHLVSALCDITLVAEVSDVLVRETGTLGHRATTVQRWPARRDERTVDVDGHAIRVKVSDQRVKVENDDAAAAARALGRPLRDVLAAAEAVARAAP
jgi:pyridinium-3,5-bisthiocarboxylic acid mononucleotide nickel chelatase